MRFFRRALAGLFLAALSLGLLVVAGKVMFDSFQARFSQERQQRPSRERIFAVNVLPAEVGDAQPTLLTFGEVRARRTLDLRSSASGTLLELASEFEEGGRVTEGQLLARIDPTEVESALAVAQTDLAESQAQLAEAQSALALAQDDLASTRQQLALQEAALERSQTLQERGIATTAVVEAAELNVSSGKQAVSSRRQALANAEAAVNRAQTAVARRNIALHNAERRVADTEIFADFSGTLTGVSAVEGGLVTINERLAQIIDTDALEVSFRVSTPQYMRLANGNAVTGTPVTILLEVSGVSMASTGTITRESAAVTKGQTGRLLFARMDSPAGFRPGDFVGVSIAEPVLENVVILPATALGNDDTILIVGEGDRLDSRQVELLRRQGDKVILRGPDLVGTSIVAERTPLLGAGIKVRPVSAESKSADEPADDGSLIELSDERRAKLLAFVEANERMPEDAKARVSQQLKEAKVPAELVNRLERRMER